MTVVTLRLDLRLARCASARVAKTQLEGIMDKLHSHFNVSVAGAPVEGELDQAVLLVAAAGRTRKDARATLERVADALSAHPKAEVLGLAINEV
jgi:uncharacterized protein YlxP (DUF503 family)